MTTTRTLAELAADLDDATRQFAEADRAERAAQQDAANAKNRLNEAQKAFDATVNAMRNGAPFGTIWHRQPHERVAERGGCL